MMGDINADEYIGCECPVHILQELTEKLSDKVLEQINATQELVMVNDFARETNERTFKKCLQDRMADISSWRWVLEDLSRRLEEALAGLKYEIKACNVVEKRINDEIQDNLKSRPGALCPKSDNVEKAIKEEQRFLFDQKNTFKELTQFLEDEVKKLIKTMNRIKNDVLCKDQTLTMEEKMANISTNNLDTANIKQRRKKTPTSLEIWEDRCRALKEDGLRALTYALISKQQVRGSRVQLTLAAQAVANKVDAALRRRLHANQTKLIEIEWQKHEAEKDLKSLETEQMTTEQSLLGNIEQEKVIEARIADRTFRPNGELTKDDVDFKLKAELARVRKFSRELRGNLEEIIRLQAHLKCTVSKLDGFMEDLGIIIQLDEERVNFRLCGDSGQKTMCPTQQSSICSQNVLKLSAEQTQHYAESNESAGEQFEMDNDIIENIPNCKGSSDVVHNVVTVVPKQDFHNYQTNLESIQEEDEEDYEDEDDYPIPY